MRKSIPWEEALNQKVAKNIYKFTWVAVKVLSDLKKGLRTLFFKIFPLQQTKKDSYEPDFDTTGMVGFWNDL